VLPVAGGRVWAGRDALEHGLVDRLGGLAEALDEVRARAGDRGARAEPFVLSPPRAPAAGLLQLLPRALNGVGPERLGEALVAFGGARERILAVLPVWPLP
jgi:ClpP class serine protease